ncbi:MAG: hypothetical protein MZW92_00595 [Comamonadaceae bacterium]|nr:hypothetical protein [Comamonadaceae bacterium]
MRNLWGGMGVTRCPAWSHRPSTSTSSTSDQGHEGRRGLAAHEPVDAADDHPGTRNAARDGRCLVQAMGQMASDADLPDAVRRRTEAAPATDAAPACRRGKRRLLLGAAMWPWQMMQQMREQMQQSAAAAVQAASGDKRQAGKCVAQDEERRPAAFSRRHSPAGYSQRRPQRQRQHRAQRASPR